jgi:hypothetical protein
MVVRDEGTSSGGFGPLNIYLMIPWTVLMGNELPEILAKWFKRMMTERSGQTGGFRFDPSFSKSLAAAVCSGEIGSAQRPMVELRRAGKAVRIFSLSPFFV